MSAGGAAQRVRGIVGEHGVLVVLLLFYLAAAVRSPNLVGIYHDDGIYIGTALSLARGEGYRIAHLPGAPLQAKYPPLFPLLLTPVAMLTGGDPSRLWAFRWPTVLCTLAALALLPELLQRWGFSRKSALAATVLAGLSPLLFQHSMLALSEGPYLLLTIGLLRWLPVNDEPLATGRMVALAAGAAAALLCRSIAVALLPALAAFAWQRRGDLRAWFPVVSAAVAATGWIVAGNVMRAREAARGLGPLYDYYLGYGAWVQADPSTLALICKSNAVSLLRGAGNVLLGWFWTGPEGLPWTILMFAVGLAVVAGLLLLAQRSLTAGTYVFCSLAISLCWPFYPERFLIPLAPLLIASAFLSYGWIARRLHLPAAVGGVLVGLATASCLAVDATHFPNAATVDVLNQQFDVAAYERSASWIRASTAPGDVIVSDHDPWVYLATGRRGLPPGRVDPLWIFGKAATADVWRQALSEHQRLGARWVLATEQWDQSFSDFWFPRFIANREMFPSWHEDGGMWIFAYRPNPGEIKP
ncbi:MAG: hypothetical protein ACYC9Y_10540 [Candidatus Methylomirabilia bacterium]